MADSQTLDRRGLDRRKFIGAAAGAAAAGATLAGPWSSSQKASADVVCDDASNPGRIPRHRFGFQTFNNPASYWNTTDRFGTYCLMFRQCGGRAWEPAGQNLGYYSQIANFGGAGPVANSMNMWAAAGSVTRANGIRLIGDHGGPTAADQALTNIGILKSNRWECQSWGNGGGFPAFGAGATSTAQWVTATGQVANWQGAADTMNLYGMRFKHGFNLDDVGPFGELAPCQRYYRHFHSEGCAYIFNTGTLYDGHYTQEIPYNECDPSHGYAQTDIAWMTDGLALGRGGPGAGQGHYPTATNNAASTATPPMSAIHPPDPNLAKLIPYYPGGINANVQVLPDVIERWQDKMPSWHCKDVGTAGTSVPSVPVGFGTSACAPGDAFSPGNGFSYPGNPAGTPFGSPSLYGEIPYTQSQDTSPFIEVFNRLRNPACHYYIIEDDAANGTGTSPNYIPKVLTQAFSMLANMALDRSYIRANWPGSICTSGIVNTSALPAWTPQNPTPANNFAGPLDPRVPDPTIPGAQAGYQGADNGSPIVQYLPTVTPHGPKVTTSATGPAAQMRYPITYWTDPTKTTRLYSPLRPPASSGAPISCTPPTLSGSGDVATSVKITDHGTWKRKPNATSYFCYRWQRNGMLIDYTGANGAPTTTCAGGENCSCCGPDGKSYKVTVADVGAEITCIVTAYNGQGSTAVVSNAVVGIGVAGPAIVQLPKVTIKKKKITVKGAVWSQGGDKTTVLQWSTSDTGPWTDVAAPYVPVCPGDDGKWFRGLSTISNDKGSSSAVSTPQQYTGFC